MSKPTMSEREFMTHQRRMKEGRGEACYESEDKFQAGSLTFLKRCGFAQRTIGEIAEHHNGLWCHHLSKKVCRTHEAPILADWVLTDARSRRYIEIELKNGNTPLSNEQKILYKIGDIHAVCRNMTEFETAVFGFLSKIKGVNNEA